MRSRTWLMALAITLLTLPTAFAAPIDVHDTRMLAQPAISATHVAFLYDGDLWLALRDGSDVHRVTTAVGDESNPRFSPDGTMLAFSAQYDGNTDVYVVPVAGGVPKRLTWHPGADVVQGFTPDGNAVLFTSGRAVYTRRHQQLFTVSLDGGMPQQLPPPTAWKATYSPDGSHIAYTPIYEAFNEWKNYRGGTITRIWLYDVASHEIEEIPKPEGGCNDTDPMWIGDKVYFRSDRNGEFNLFSYDTGTKAVAQLTTHDDFPIVNASAGAGVVIYEQAGYLRVFDPATGETQKLTLGVPADLRETRPRYASGARWIRNAGISPSGARAVFEFRGEIVTVPAEKGDPRDITQSTGANDRSPAWSPDGQWIAYFSDDTGEYTLKIAPQDGRGDVRSFAIDGAGFYEDPKWSPDGTMISFTDNSWSLYLLDVASGRVRKLASEPLYGARKTLHHAWSPDSKWLAYTLNTEMYFGRAYLYDVANDEHHAITDGLSDVGEPVFDASGKYLYFYASTDAGPTKTWFAQSNADADVTRALYLAVLPSGVDSPFAKESDEEEPAEDEKGGSDETMSEDRNDDAAASDAVTVDFDGLSDRIVALPVDEAFYSGLAAGKAGQLFYLKRTGSGGPFGGASLVRFDVDERKETTLAENVGGFVLTYDGAKVLFTSRNAWTIAGTGGKVDPGKGRLAVDDVSVKIDPRAEWAQIFNEAWRINRDYFYDPNYHGADWQAMRDKYDDFLPDLATRNDLRRLLQWMHSELTVGHARGGGGDRLDRPESIPGGLLGADYEVANGRYRFQRVFGGLNWNPDLRAPLTEPGVEVQDGEYLLAVDGVDLRPPENLYSRFENTAGKLVELTVGPNADGSGSRTVQVVPIRNEGNLRNRAWVEGNIQKVNEATGGRVAYVYVPNTAGLGFTYFKRYFYPQADKDAIIVDERHNAGGQVADYYIDLLRRPYISNWAMRYGDDLRTPQAAILGPKVMLIDETAGSGGDLLPWMFHKLGLGPLVGKRTWGGLVGILGFPVLMDGATITAPNLAIWTEDGFVVENRGVPPDVEVEQLPKEVIEGHDPQLEKAIETVMQMLEENPPHKPQRPPYPIRVRR